MYIAKQNSKMRQSKKATDCIVPTVWHFGKGKTREIAK
jgi:hypothetical protein